MEQLRQHTLTGGNLLHTIRTEAIRLATRDLCQFVTAGLRRTLPDLTGI
jgi:hypothetical protein